MNSKETVLKFYSEVCEKSLPGKGQAAASIVEKYWDSDAQKLADAYASIAPMQVLKEMAAKQPAMASEIKALRN